MLKPNDRKISLLKLSISVPSYFNANISPKKLKLCQVNLGGMLSKTKCIDKIPAVFEVNKDQTNIDIFPDQPIPTEGSYAVVMKIFNPRKRGMFQFQAFSQNVGEIDISTYLGTWNIDVQ